MRNNMFLFTIIDYIFIRKPLKSILLFTYIGNHFKKSEYKNLCGILLFSWSSDIAVCSPCSNLPPELDVYLLILMFATFLASFFTNYIFKPKGNSLTGSDRSAAGSIGFCLKTSNMLRVALHQDNFDLLEYPFLTMLRYPPGFILHLGEK